MEYTKRFQELSNSIENGEPLSAEQLEFQEDISCSDGFEYGLIDGGYIKTELLLEGKSLEEFKKALEIYKQVKRMWDRASYEF